jgi:hypothetical protein
MRDWLNMPFKPTGDVGTVADIEAFFRAPSGGHASQPRRAPFNGDSDTGTDQDIDAFFGVLGGGDCQDSVHIPMEGPVFRAPFLAPKLRPTECEAITSLMNQL